MVDTMSDMKKRFQFLLIGGLIGIIYCMMNASGIRIRMGIIGLYASDHNLKAKHSDMREKYQSESIRTTDGSSVVNLTEPLRKRIPGAIIIGVAIIGVVQVLQYCNLHKHDNQLTLAVTVPTILVLHESPS